MEKDKLLRDIGLDLDILQAHIKRLKKSNTRMHQLDADLLLDSTRKLYDRILKLKIEDDANLKTIVLPETMPEAEIPEVSLSSQEIDTSSLPVKEHKETIEEQEPLEDPELVEEKEIDEAVILPEEKITDSIPEIEQEHKQSKSVEKQQEVEPVKEANDEPITEKTTFDLFTSNAEETVADKLSNKDDSSVAAKMQHSKISDLKQAIGINEKFLFINELFNGDLGRYNKVIDEFNELKNQQGIDTYLLEMKIQNQWAEDSEAYLKLKKLLDRKFG